MQITISATTALMLSIYAIEPAMEKLTKDAKELDKLKAMRPNMNRDHNHYRDALESFRELNISINQELNRIDQLMKEEIANYNKTQQQ